MRRTLIWLTCAFALAACRDEQAGLKRVAQPGMGQPGAPQPVGEMKVLDNAPFDLNYRSGATWGQGSVVYIGSRVEPADARPGMTVRFTHYFEALRQPPPGFHFFAHLIDGVTGEQLANLDHEIQNGAAPLERWPVGKVIEDQHVVQVPPHDGKVRLVMGFWTDQGRLIVDDPSAHDGRMRMLGPELGAEAPLPEYHAVKADKPPVIDGELNDPIWQKAHPVILQGSLRGQPVRWRTEAKVAWDSTNIYVAFDCEDPDVWGTLMNHDDAIYTQSVVEIFLDANADGKTYNELEVSPHNVTFDAAFDYPRSDLKKAMSWESGMTSAVKVRGTIDNSNDHDDGFSVEMAIPISKLYEVPPGSPKVGDKWRFNLYRLAGNPQSEGQAFSPTMRPDFHNVSRFGWLIFDP